MFKYVKYKYLRYFFGKSVALLKISFYLCKNIYKNICKSRKIFPTTTKIGENYGNKKGVHDADGTLAQRAV